MSIALPLLAFVLIGAFAAYHRLRLATWAALVAVALVAGWLLGAHHVTLAVLAIVLWSEVRGNTDMNVFRRRLPAKLVRQGLAVALLAIGLVVGASLALMSIEDVSLTPKR